MNDILLLRSSVLESLTWEAARTEDRRRPDLLPISVVLVVMLPFPFPPWIACTFCEANLLKELTACAITYNPLLLPAMCEWRDDADYDEFSLVHISL